MRIGANPRWAMIVSLALVPLVAPSPAQAGEWSIGDVFVGAGNGQYFRYNNAGVFQEAFGTGGTAETTGCAFESDAAGGNLWTTYFQDEIVRKHARTHPHGELQAIPQGEFSAPESIVFAANGHFFVGHPDAPNAEIVEYDAAGNQIDADPVAADNRGSDWIDLSADQRTMFYTSEGAAVQRFDVVNDIQLPNFATGVGSFALRLLPPGDGSGGLLVADVDDIKRLDGAGNVVQNYGAPGEGFWFALNLDPNGTSFWSGNIETANFYRFNINSGAVEVGPINTGTGQLAGICLLGEITAAEDTTRPTCRILSRTNEQVVVRIQDTQSGLREIVVSDPQNATVSVPPFSPGTTDPVDVTATKINSSQPARFRLLATDMQDNQTRCTSMGIIPF